MARVNLIRSWTLAILYSFSQETDFLIKVIMKSVNIKLWDILGCFHYILNAPRNETMAIKRLTLTFQLKSLHWSPINILKVHVTTPCDKLAKMYSKYFGNMSKMTATPIYAKPLLKSSSEIERR